MLFCLRITLKNTLKFLLLLSWCLLVMETGVCRCTSCVQQHKREVPNFHYLQANEVENIKGKSRLFYFPLQKLWELL